jgi:3-oxoacyl-[acyl-carrier protein] reductase
VGQRGVAVVAVSHVLLTGAASGIGLASLRALRSSGHVVSAGYHRRPIPEDVLADGGVTPIELDVTDSESVVKAVAEAQAAHGPVEVLVANAGLTDDQLLLRMSEEAWERTVDLDLTSAFRLTKAVVPGMLRARRGRIIYISSVVAMTGSPGQTSYAAAKAGLVGLARSLAREVGSRGITVNVVMPGMIDTDLLRATGEERLEQILTQVPLGRMGTPEEAASVIAFLASEAASYVTGAIVPVDGGLGMGL